MVIFAAGGQFKYMLGAAGAFLGILIPFIFLVPYARGRIDIWWHPEKYSSQSETWQTLQGLNAVGSGGFFGVGLGQSLQKHMFVSQPQNDFVFTIICEELGFFGATAILLLFFALVARGIILGSRAPDKFTALVIYGLTFKLAIHVFLNVGVVSGMLPNTGISLPFFSSGGSATISQMIDMGIILGLSRFCTQKK
jgi:cell division protein FtsW